jgi:pyruvate dehydrogenase E1 component alpha subunit
MKKSLMKEMYEKMLQIRKFEEKAAELFSMGLVHGTMHLYIGQEAIAVGACCALDKDDMITSTHRGHGHCIARGIDLNRMMAEFLGREDGYCRGKGGSMHVADLSKGNLGANGVVGGGIPIAVGAGLTTHMKKMDRVVLCFFGDGATNQGSFHESLNLASIWNLPVLFLCENNLYSMSMHVERHLNIRDLSVRASSYGMPGKTVNGNDVMAVYQCVKEAKAHIKKNGPVLIVANTYRIAGHSKSDANAYRSKKEIEKWKAKCPIKRFRKTLIENRIYTEATLDRMERKATEDIANAVAFAQSRPYPSPDTITRDVYA